MNKQKLIIQDQLNDNPEPHQRQSIKGLFTFYREQQEMQMTALKSLTHDKAKNNQRRIKSPVKISSENQPKDVRTEKSLKKKRSKKDVAMQENLSKSKRKKRNKKILKQQKYHQHLFEIQEGSKTVPLNEEEQEDPAARFLKKIKQRKITKSPQLAISNPNEPQLTIVENELHEKQKFNRLFYPKESEVSQNLVDNLAHSFDKIEPVNKFVKFNDKKSRDKQQSDSNQIFFQRSSSAFKKSSGSRKRNYTDLDVNLLDKPLLGNSVKKNFYSHKKLEEIVRLAHRVGNRQQTEPISPPSQVKHDSIKSRTLKTQQEISESIKLPEIKNTRLSKQLKKVEQLIAEQLQKYGSNKSKKSGKKLNKSRQLQSRNLVEYSNKQKAALKRKLETEPQTYCVALIDLSKSTSRQPELNNISTSWSSKKKLLFKKLGINL